MLLVPPRGSPQPADPLVRAAPLDPLFIRSVQWLPADEDRPGGLSHNYACVVAAVEELGNVDRSTESKRVAVNRTLHWPNTSNTEPGLADRRTWARQIQGKPLPQALGVVSYDANETYRMRAFNDGRFLETEVKLLASGKGIAWGFALGEIKTSSVLRINDKGEWTELGEIKIGGTAPVKFMELTVRRQK